MTTINAIPSSLYVGDLHPEVGDAQLFDAFSEFQSLGTVRVCRDSTNGLSLCYGYVNFHSAQDGMIINSIFLLIIFFYFVLIKLSCVWYVP